MLVWLGTALIAALAVTFAFALSKVIEGMYRAWEDTEVEDVDVEDIDITDILPKNVTLPRDKDKPDKNPNNKPKPDPLVPVPGPGDKTKKDDECEPYGIDTHLGGDTIHDLVANVIPPNRKNKRGKLGDWILKGEYFDAYSTKGELWEVKTDNYSKSALFIQDITVKKYRNDMEKDFLIASSCGFPYVFGVTDKQLYNDLLPRVPIGVQLRLINQP